MSFVVEIPSIFTKPTQIPVRLGNTILTGSETIQGSLAVNGSLTLNNSNITDSNSRNVVYYDSLDVSNTLSVGGDVSMNGNATITGSITTNDLVVNNSLEVAFDGAINLKESNLAGSATQVISYTNYNTLVNDVAGKQDDIDNTIDVSCKTLTTAGNATIGGSLSHINDFSHFYIEANQNANGVEYIIKNFLDGSLTGNAIRIDSSGGTTNNDLFVAQKTGYFKINATFNYKNTGGLRIAIRTQLFKNDVYQDANESFCYVRMGEGMFGSNVINSIIQLNAGDIITSRASMSLTWRSDFTSDTTGYVNIQSASIVFEYIG